MEKFLSQGDIVLRAICPDDASLFLKWHNDPKLRDDIGGVFPFTERDFMDVCECRLNENPANVWFAVEKHGKLIGITGLHNIKYINRNAEIAVLIGDTENRCQGNGTAMIQMILKYAFRDLGLHRVYAQIYAGNLSSMCLFEKCGFEKEGVLREARWWDGIFKDVYIYGKICE